MSVNLTSSTPIMSNVPTTSESINSILTVIFCLFCNFVLLLVRIWLRNNCNCDCYSTLIAWYNSNNLLEKEDLRRSIKHTYSTGYGHIDLRRCIAFNTRNFTS